MLQDFWLETEQRVDLPFVEAYYHLAVYDGGGGGLGVHLDHLLHGVEVGTDILLGKIDVPLREKLYLCVADASAGRRIDDYVLSGHSYSSITIAFSSLSSVNCSPPFRKPGVKRCGCTWASMTSRLTRSSFPIPDPPKACRLCPACSRRAARLPPRSNGVGS